MKTFYLSASARAENKRACLLENFLFVVVSFIIVIITSLIHKGSPVKRSVDGIPVFILGLDVGDDCFPVVVSSTMSPQSRQRFAVV